ncbi:MAG: DUF308 domain-containing protein [Deltaproteobacteria bacterium]|nr:MAG: DUF308 domain-containing protein [Deltaproteobacteria bacterium]
MADPPPEVDPAAGVPEGFDPKMPYRRLETEGSTEDKGGCSAAILVVVLIFAGGSVIAALIGVLGMFVGVGQITHFFGGSERGPRVEWPSVLGEADSDEGPHHELGPDEQPEPANPPDPETD